MSELQQRWRNFLVPRIGQGAKVDGVDYVCKFVENETAALLVRIAELEGARGRCRIDGKPCTEHEGVVHGKEAEELRSAIEVLAAKSDTRTAAALQVILDQVDARDSLAFLEAFDRAPAQAEPQVTNRPADREGGER